MLRVLIENNFHREDLEDLDLTNIVQGIDDDDMSVALYTCESEGKKRALVFK